MDPHRFDADLDPDPTFHFDADPDPDPTYILRPMEPSPSYTHVKKVRGLLKHYLALFYFSLQRHRCRNFLNLNSILKFSGNKFSLALKFG